LGSSDDFGVEKAKAHRAIEWMNSYAKANNKEFESILKGYDLVTKRFGVFEMIFWKGDWGVAREIIRRASSKLNMKVVEGGYHEKNSSILLRMFGTNKEFAKVYSGGNLIGTMIMSLKSGKWSVKSEKTL
jgi:hypothetical protein